jgi:hypothetical protein
MREDGKGLIVEGEYETGADVRTVRGCGLRLSVSPRNISLSGLELDVERLMGSGHYKPRSGRRN